MANFDKTMSFKVERDANIKVKEILKEVYDALVEKGYNPINQIVGYILSGDPTYITSYIKEEIKRLEVEISKLESEVARCNKMLSNPGFINKAPESKINEEKEKLAKYEEMLNASKERLEKIRK